MHTHAHTLIEQHILLHAYSLGKAEWLYGSSFMSLKSWEQLFFVKHANRVADSREIEVGAEGRGEVGRKWVWQ